MKFRIRARARPLFVAGLVSVVSLAGAPGAQAQMVYFQGYTNGCFGAACAPPVNSGFQAAAVNSTFAFQNSQFDGMTVDGTLQVGNSATAPMTQNVGNFGAFYLASNARDYNGMTFNLLITFVSPVAHSQFYMAALSGRVVAPTSGGVTVNFDNSQFFWNDGGRTFSVSINDVDLISPTAGGFSSAPITGRLTATEVTQVVPEPMTMTLLGTGLLAIGGVVRRRRRKAGQADLI